MVSETWRQLSLGEVATLQRGYDLPHKERKPGTVPIISSSGSIDTHNEARAAGPGVVTGRYGTIGEVFFVSEDFWPLNTTLFVKDFKGNDPLFISFLLRTIDYHSYSGKSGVPGVNRNDLHEIGVSLPPLSEQHAIATALSDVDALITSLNRLIAKKRDIKQAIMQQLLTGKTRLPGFSGDWEAQVLGEIAEIIDPHPSHRAPPESYNGIPFVGIGDISTDGKINYQTSRIVSEMIFEQHNKRYSLENGLIGIGRVASIGKVVRLLPNVGKFVVSPTIAVIKPQKVEIDLLFYCLTSKEVKGQFDRISNGSTRQSVGMNVLRDIQLFLPKSLVEQQAIADILTDMDAEIAALEQKRDKTRALKQGMMQELLTGKTRLL